ncbi:MAG: glycoside hydrolase, partial [Phycisphaerae bacterium]
GPGRGGLGRARGVVATPGGGAARGVAGIGGSDACDWTGGGMPLVWQWNHNPDDGEWSVTERAGYLRLKTGRVDSEWVGARNTLTQRMFGPTCAGSVAMEVGGMKDGDVAGLGALQKKYGFVGVKREGDAKFVVMEGVERDGALEEGRVALGDASRVYLKVSGDFRERADVARFYYSLDGTAWKEIGKPLHMVYTLPHFMGYRFGLFHFAKKAEGGSVYFYWFRVGK